MPLWSPTDVKEYIKPEEAAEIISSCENYRDKLILQTMWETGGRVTEVLSLKPGMIDLINNCIYLPNLKQRKIRKGTKNKRKDNTPPLKRIFMFPESTLCQTLTDYYRENKINTDSWIFRGKSRDGRVSRMHIWYLLSNRDWGRKHGLAAELNIRKIKGGSLKPVWPHLFRHGAAMNMLHRTGRLDVVQFQLGHRSIVTTEDYATLSDEDRKAIIYGRDVNSTTHDQSYDHK